MLKEKKNYIMSAILSSVIAITLWCAFSVSEKNGTVIRETVNGNLMAFIVISCVFVVSFFLFVLIEQRCAGCIIHEKLKLVGTIAVLGFIIVCLIWQFFVEENILPERAASIYIRHNIPPIFYFGMVGIGVVVIEKSDFTIMKDIKNRVVFGAILSIATAICQYCPNAFYDGLGGLYHYDAYVNSIFNVLHGNAYSDINLSIYGHYGILYYPLVKILGGDRTTISVARAISVITYIVILCAELTIIKMIKNEKVFVLTALAIPAGFVMVYLNGVYNQVAPHRYLFPTTIMCYVAWQKWDDCHKKKQLMAFWLGWILCTLAIIWNTETGIFCAVGYAVYHYYLYAEKQIKIDIKFLWKFFELCLCIGISFLAAYEVVNLYNILNGGNVISVNTYIYPILAKEYNINSLIVKVPQGINSYIFEMLLFLVSGCLVITKNSIFEKRECMIMKEKRGFILMTSLIGMGCFTYYINRAVYYNMSISHIELIILMGILCEILLEAEYKNKVNLINGVGKILLVVLLVIALGTMTYTSANMMKKIESSWKTEELMEETKNIFADIPKDTFAFGKGVELIYGEFDWNPRCATIDFPDMNQKALDYIVESLKKENDFFAEREALDTLKIDLSQFTLVKEYNVCGFDYVYYVRNKL